MPQDEIKITSAMWTKSTNILSLIINGPDGKWHSCDVSDVMRLNDAVALSSAFGFARTCMPNIFDDETWLDVKEALANGTYSECEKPITDKYKDLYNGTKYYVEKKTLTIESEILSKKCSVIISPVNDTFEVAALLEAFLKVLG